MRFLVAFDKFKDSMSAETICGLSNKALRKCQPDATVESTPLTDGGEGFSLILSAARNGWLENLQVTGPLGKQQHTRIAWVRSENLPSHLRTLLKAPETGQIAIIEMAQCSGLELVPTNERNPMLTTSYGTGEAIQHAAEHSARLILLGIGGSATSDCGIGAIQALGLQINEKNIPWTPIQWDANSTWVPQMKKLPPLRIACDVQNPLLGENGANAVYGSQKGMTEETYPILEKTFEQVSKRLIALFNRNENCSEEPSSGAAGGIGFGLSCAYDDTLYIPGFDLVSQWLDLEGEVKKSDCILTGEGRFDASSLSGKGPGTLIELAKKYKKPIHVFAGKITDEAREMAPKEAHLHQIAPPGVSVEEAILNEKKNLVNELLKTFS